MELCQTTKKSSKLFTDAMTGMNKKFYVDGRDHENLLAANGNASSSATTTTATTTTTTTTVYGICLSTNSLFWSLFSTTNPAKTDILYHEQCTSTKDNKYITTNNELTNVDCNFYVFGCKYLT